MRPVLAVMAAGLVGCGWHAGLVLPDGSHSVGVAIPRSDPEVLERDLEPLLHDHLSRAVSDLVDASLVSPDDADLVLESRIVGYQRRAGVRSKEQVLLETAVGIVVEAKLVRRATGEVLGSTRASIPAGYVTADRVGEGHDPSDFLQGGRENELDARDRVLRFIADQVVLDLFGTQEPEVP